MTIETARDAFDADFNRDGAALVWTRRIDDLETPVAAMLKFGAHTPGACLLESVTGGDQRGRFSAIGMDPDAVFRIVEGRPEISRSGGFEDADFAPLDAEPLAALRAFLAESRVAMAPGLPPIAAGVFGYFSYDMVRFVERLQPCPPDPLGAPDAVLIRPRVVAVFDGVRHETLLVTPARRGVDGDTAAEAFARASARLDAALKVLDAPLPARSPPQPGPDRPSQPTSNMAKARFLNMVEAAKGYIRAGDIFQVVPSQRFSAPFRHPAFALYRALRRTNPSPFLFYFNLAGFSIVGASPEILVRLRDGVVTVRPIAGTRPRGATPAQDRALEEELLADPKERAEHLMLLDLGRNDVGRVAQRGAKGAGVRVTERFTVERYSHVMHIVSNVEGELAPDEDALSALFAGFPAGTVSGAPKVRAMEIIAELEPHRRGVYAGGVGYFSAGGEMDTCIALRTGVVKDGCLHVQAGGGIVLDSDPESEFAETEHKARALFRAAEEAWRYA
jgi:anthranilate synthase component 1